MIQIAMHLKLSKVLSYKRHLLFMLTEVGTSFIFIPYGLHKQMFKEKKNEKQPQTSHNISLIAFLPFNGSLKHLCMIWLGPANHRESTVACACKKPSQGGNVFPQVKDSHVRLHDIPGREQFQVQPERHKADRQRIIQ